jgi:signal transduction histidine kinase
MASERVLVLAPMGRDAQLIAGILGRSGIRAEVCPGISELCQEIPAGAGAVILAEEGLKGSGPKLLRETLTRQEPWSDLPLIILTTGGEIRSAATWEIVKGLDPVGNVSLLERPLRSLTLVSAVQVALRSRRRQYEVQSLYEGLEQRVADRTAELQRMNVEAEGFSYSISHDLRAPLRAIGATSRMLLTDYAESLPPDAVEKLQRQVDAANRLAVLIDDLLHLSRLSRQEMRWDRVDLSALASEVARDLEGQAQARGVRFCIDSDLYARGDSLLLKFVLLNLMQNAVKFSVNGGRVSVGQREDGVFFVKDQGVGFDMTYAEKMFLPFERLVRDDEFPGTGIGLANVRRIVDRHGGRVWADSTPGNGATFFFALPQP